MDHRESRESVLAELSRLHDEVDREAGALEQLHRQRLSCKRGCSDCCVDELTVFDFEHPLAVLYEVRI